MDKEAMKARRERQLVRFDWAIKRLLRHKADHSVLEGFLTSLLNRPIKIVQILESESNRDYEENKQNRVDIIALDSDGSRILIEVQNESEDSYFHRMLFATSRTIAELLRKGDNYDRISKIYSVNIVYFNLGEGTDYVYTGRTVFHGLHNNEELKLPSHLKYKYGVEGISDLYPEYYILKANDFDRWSKEHLDQWMYFLANSSIPEDADAPGLREAAQELEIARLPIEEQEAYYQYLRDMNSMRHLVSDAWDRGVFEGKKEGMAEGIEKGKKEGMAEGIEKERRRNAKALKDMGVETSIIIKSTGLTEAEISSL